MCVRERERELYLSSQCDDTGEVTPVLGHTLEVAEYTLELGSLCRHSPFTTHNKVGKYNAMYISLLLQYS